MTLVQRHLPLYFCMIYLLLHRMFGLITVFSLQDNKLAMIQRDLIFSFFGYYRPKLFNQIEFMLFYSETRLSKQNFMANWSF
jgi:hypothetical protein